MRSTDRAPAADGSDDVTAVPRGKVRVAVCDDHPLVIEGLCSLLSLDSAIELVGTATNASGALTLARDAQPDVFLMDLQLPGMSGFELAEQIRQRNSAVRLVALTAHEGRDYVDRAREMGFAGYILKRTSLRQLLEAIKSIATGAQYFDPLVMHHLLDGADAAHEQLTDRERAVAMLLARGYANKEVAKELSISAKTVETHRAHIFQKLSLHGRADLVRYAMQQGWLNDA